MKRTSKSAYLLPRCKFCISFENKLGKCGRYDLKKLNKTKNSDYQIYFDFYFFLDSMNQRYLFFVCVCVCISFIKIHPCHTCNRLKKKKKLELWDFSAGRDLTEKNHDAFQTGDQTGVKAVYMKNRVFQEDGWMDRQIRQIDR